MEWVNPLVKADVAAHSESAYEQQVIELAEIMGERYESGGTLEEWVPPEGFSLNQVLDALLLVSSAHVAGTAFLESLPLLLRWMVSYKGHEVLALWEQYAATIPHRGEADEILSDSE